MAQPSHGVPQPPRGQDGSDRQERDGDATYRIDDTADDVLVEVAVPLQPAGADDQRRQQR